MALIEEKFETKMLGIIDGKISLLVKPEEGFMITKETKRGTSYFKLFDKVSGYIRDIRRNDDAHYTNLIVEIADYRKNEQYKLVVPLYDRYARDFMMRLPNINQAIVSTTPLVFAPFMFPSNTINPHTQRPYVNRGIALYQAGEKIEKYLYQLPEPEDIMVQGKPAKDYDNQINFLWEETLKLLPSITQ